VSSQDARRSSSRDAVTRTLVTRVETLTSSRRASWRRYSQSSTRTHRNVQRPLSRWSTRARKTRPQSGHVHSAPSVAVAGVGHVGVPRRGISGCGSTVRS